MVTIVNWSSSKKLLLSQLLKRIKHQHGDNAMMGSYFLPFKEWLFGICSLGCGDSRSAASSLDTQGHLRSLHTTAPCRHHHHREHLHYQWFIYSRVWKFIDQVFNALARRKPAAKKFLDNWTLDTGQACFVFRTHETGKSSSSEKLYCAKPAFRSSDFYEDNDKRQNVDRPSSIRTSFF